MATSIGPRCFLELQYPQEWRLDSDLSSTQLMLRDRAGQGWLVDVYSEPLRRRLVDDVDVFSSVFLAHLVSEGAEHLYGFDTPNFRYLFLQLQAIKGVNTNVAASAVSVLGPQVLLALMNQGPSAMTKKVSGMGPKTLEKLAYELGARKKKFLPLLSQFEGTQVLATPSSQKNSWGPGPSSVLAQSLERLGMPNAETTRLYQALLEQKPDLKQASDEEWLTLLLRSRGQQQSGARSSETSLKKQPVVEDG